MPQSNGKSPHHHLSVREIVALHKERSLKPWHSDLLDMDFLIRPHTGAEMSQLADESTRLMADMEEYKGTPDAPGSIEQLRLGVRSMIPVLLDPETKEPRFGMDEVDDLLELEMPILNELMEAANSASTFTQEQAEDAVKNSEETVGSNTSSVSPSTAVTPI